MHTTEIYFMTMMREFQLRANSDRHGRGRRLTDRDADGRRYPPPFRVRRRTSTR